MAPTAASVTLASFRPIDRRRAREILQKLYGLVEDAVAVDLSMVMATLDDAERAPRVHERLAARRLVHDILTDLVYDRTVPRIQRIECSASLGGLPLPPGETEIGTGAIAEEDVRAETAVLLRDLLRRMEGSTPAGQRSGLILLRDADDDGARGNGTSTATH
jgi:hypothetical protein